MGDPRRFDLFSDFVAKKFCCDVPVVEVASGNGKLHGALRRRGFSDLVGFDKRHRNAGPRRIFRYGHFNCHNAERGYGLVVGMHPDQGTDHIIGYAGKHRVPFAVCPCCVLPSAFPYQGYRYEHWIDHLVKLAEGFKMRVEVSNLPMTGRNIVIAGWPERSSFAMAA